MHLANRILSLTSGISGKSLKNQKLYRSCALNKFRWFERLWWSLKRCNIFSSISHLQLPKPQIQTVIKLNFLAEIDHSDWYAAVTLAIGLLKIRPSSLDFHKEITKLICHSKIFQIKIFQIKCHVSRACGSIFFNGLWI